MATRNRVPTHTREIHCRIATSRTKRTSCSSATVIEYTKSARKMTVSDTQTSELSRPDRPTVFLSYSRKDERSLKDLRTMLTPLVRSGGVDVWWDGEIQASQIWREEIDKALAAACIGVLLVSKDFLASDFIAQ